MRLVSEGHFWLHNEVKTRGEKLSASVNAFQDATSRFL